MPAALDPLLGDGGSRSLLLLGNEAIVRGAIEAGVGFVSGYPGTPSSEVTDRFARLAPILGIPFEYSVNEKVALEVAFAASLAGARALVAMKHLGLVYAGDPLSTLPYVGTRAGLVIVSAADPGCRTSPNEQDQRWLGPMLHLPVLDPRGAGECLALTRLAFEVSERARLPVLLRPTARVAHTRAAVRLGDLRPRPVPGFRRDPEALVPIPPNARRMRAGLDLRLAAARDALAEAGTLERRGRGARAVLATGAPAATLLDLWSDLGLEDEVRLVTLSAPWPLQEPGLLEALRDARQLLVVEELSPFLEDQVAALACRRGLALAVRGQRSGDVPGMFELEPDALDRALRRFAGRPAPEVAPRRPAPEVPARPPILCASCPHRATYHAARAAFADDQLFFNDIGCYTLGYDPPLETADALLCMGAGFSLAAGVARTTGRRTVGFLGDSTFFHSGMPALLDAVKERASVVAVILDNAVTAMTGFQDSPGAGRPSPRPDRTVSIEAVVRALGVTSVERVDPYDMPAAVAAFRRAGAAEGVAVVIAERTCPVYLERVAPAAAPAIFAIDHARCRSCGRQERGSRCAQQATEPFSRALARARSQEVEPAEDFPAGVAPCALACPLELCVQGYATHLVAGQDREAYDLIRERLALPESVCRVCDRPCEAACVRAGDGGAVAINDLKRFAVARAADLGHDPAPVREPFNGRRVAIAGAGPAGLAAAHELRLRGYAVTVHDGRPAPGGMLRAGIPAYRLPPAALERDLERLRALGIELVAKSRLGREVSLQRLLAGPADAVLLAVGAWRSRRLGLQPVAGAPAVAAALDFLLAPPVGLPGPAVVIGGGNAAIDAARTALRLGASPVTVVALEPRRALPAIPSEVEAALAEGVVLHAGARVLGLVAGGVQCAPVEGGGPAFRLAAALVIEAIGQDPDRDFLGPGDPPLEWTTDGLLAVDAESGRTSHPRVFAAGDLVSTRRSVVEAMASGLRAAWGIDRALRGEAVADRRKPPPPRTRPPVRLPPVARIDRVARARAGEREPAARARRFDEVALGLGEAEARREAARCLVCGRCGNCRACIDSFGCPAFVIVSGRIEIDPLLCTGCGVCAALCPDRAIAPLAAAAVGA